MSDDHFLVEAPAKWKCGSCGGVTGEPLCAPSPFDPDDTLHACPSCLAVNDLTAACQHPDCSKFASGGHPGGLGYRYAWLCWDHSPNNQVNETPKSEHDASDMLSTAAKGDA